MNVRNDLRVILTSQHNNVTVNVYCEVYEKVPVALCGTLISIVNEAIGDEHT